MASERYLSGNEIHNKNFYIIDDTGKPKNIKNNFRLDNFITHRVFKDFRKKYYIYNTLWAYSVLSDY